MALPGDRGCDPGAGRHHGRSGRGAGGCVAFREEGKESKDPDRGKGNRGNGIGDRPQGGRFDPDLSCEDPGSEPAFADRGDGGEGGYPFRKEGEDVARPPGRSRYSYNFV